MWIKERNNLSDISTYVKKAKEGKTDLQEVMERRKSKKIQELEELEIDAFIAEAKDKIRKTPPERLDSTTTTNFAAMLFAGRKPEEIKQILNSLSQEEIDRLAYIAASMNPNNLLMFRGSLREPSTTARDIVEAIKVGVDAAKKPSEGSGGVDLKGLAEIFKAGVEAAKAQNPQPQQDPLAMYKAFQDMMQPVITALSGKDKEIMELKINELRNQIVDPMSWLKMVKAASGELGLSPAGKGEIDLKIAEMAQMERIEGKKMEFEEKKWEYDKANEGKIFTQITDAVKTVTEGPVGDAIKAIGEAQADKMRGSITKTNRASIIQIKCPACSGTFRANSDLVLIMCPLCGTQLQKPSQPAPQPSPEQPSQQAQAQTEQPQAEAQGSVEQPPSQ